MKVKICCEVQILAYRGYKIKSCGEITNGSGNYRKWKIFNRNRTSYN